MSDPSPSKDLSWIRKYPDKCEAGVSRAGEYESCDKPAVAGRVDDGEFAGYPPYPVCAYHARGTLCVPLRTLLGLDS